MGTIKDRIIKHENDKSLIHWKPCEQQGFEKIIYSRITTLKIGIQQCSLYNIHIYVYLCIDIITRLPNLIKHFIQHDSIQLWKSNFILTIAELTKKVSKNVTCKLLFNECGRLYEM